MARGGRQKRMKATQNRRGSLHSLKSDDIRDSRISFGDTGSGSAWIAITRATQQVIHLADAVRPKRSKATVKKTRPNVATMTKSAPSPDHTPPDSRRESGMNSLSCRTMRLVPRRSFHHSQALPAAIKKTSATKTRATKASKRQMAA